METTKIPERLEIISPLELFAIRQCILISGRYSNISKVEATIEHNGFKRVFITFPDERSIEISSSSADGLMAIKFVEGKIYHSMNMGGSTDDYSLLSFPIGREGKEEINGYAYGKLEHALLNKISEMFKSKLASGLSNLDNDVTSLTNSVSTIPEISVLFSYGLYFIDLIYRRSANIYFPYLLARPSGNGSYEFTYSVNVVANTKDWSSMAMFLPVGSGQDEHGNFVGKLFSYGRGGLVIEVGYSIEAIPSLRFSSDRSINSEFVNMVGINTVEAVVDELVEDINLSLKFIESMETGELI